MGQKQEQLNIALRQLATGTIPVFVAIVKAVDNDTNTCTIDYNGVDVEGVYLSSKGEKDKTLVVYPKVNKPAIFSRIGSSNQFFMIHCAEAEKIIIEAGNSLIEVENDLIRINGGSFGGLVKIADLTSKLNALENDLNTLKQVFSSWVTVPNDGGAALKTASATWAGQTLTVTQQGSIENTKVKH